MDQYDSLLLSFGRNHSFLFLMHRPRITLNIRWGHLFMFMNLVEGPFSRTKKYASILCDFIDHYFLYRNAYQRNAPKTNRTKKNHSLTHTHTHYIHQWFIDVRYFEADSKCYLCCCIQILMKALVWNMSTVFCGLSAMACLQFACVRFVLLITSQKSLRTNNKLEGETCDTEKCLSYIE